MKYLLLILLPLFIGCGEVNRACPHCKYYIKKED